jgi:hypothetical protein
MPYDYQSQKHLLFTDEGQRTFLKLRDRVLCLIEKTGAIRCQEALREYLGDSFLALAILDRMIELGEIRKIEQGRIAGQYEIYVSAKPE